MGRLTAVADAADAAEVLFQKSKLARVFQHGYDHLQVRASLKKVIRSHIGLLNNCLWHHQLQVVELLEADVIVCESSQLQMRGHLSQVSGDFLVRRRCCR
jgi:hypothetical protein